MNKQIITASVCLLASLTIAGITGKNFMDVKKPDELRPGPGVTQTKMLSDYFPDIAGTNADSTVYVMEAERCSFWAVPMRMNLRGISRRLPLWSRVKWSRGLCL